MANYHRRRRQEAPRADRRRHDGLQEGARRGRRRLRQGRRAAPRSRAARRWPSAAPSARPSAGLVATSGGALVELNCETDFVAKGEPTSSPLPSRSPTPPTRPRPATSRRSRPSRSTARPSARSSTTSRSRIGEKIELGRVAYFDGPVVVYMHKRAADLPPAVGVLVEYDGDEDAARGAAMQVAAMRPQYLTRDEVPADVVAKEREIAEATSREEGKPEQAIAKITEGRLNGFFKDVVLLEQPSVTENKKTRQGRPRRGRHHREAVRPLRGRRLSGRLDRLVRYARSRSDGVGAPGPRDRVHRRRRASRGGPLRRGVGLRLRRRPVPCSARTPARHAGSRTRGQQHGAVPAGQHRAHPHRER